jgi:hemolysin activation/secretion protein
VEVPVFLMATLGGGDYLRGYSSYRFRDRNAALLQTEYRYAVHKMVDVAFLYETGTVAPAAGKLNVNHLEHSVAGGIRLHTKTSGLLRMDLAHGRDGWKIAFGVGIGGS